MRFTDEQRRLLWLSAAEITADRVQRMIEKRGSASALWEDYRQGDPLTANAEAAHTLARYHSEAALDALCERIELKGVTVLFQSDAAYPALLKCIDDAPYVLYAMGDADALRRPAVAVVGTRYPSGYGKNVAQAIAAGLGQAGVTVVSGLARGIDTSAHEGAIEGGGPTVAVLGSGVNVPYPFENVGLYRRIVEGAGVVLSEYPMDAAPITYHFPHRNRVISGLSHGIVFVEGKVKSGGMITVRTALDQGREVFAVPGCVGQSVSEGPHAIIREGARLVTSAEDVLLDMGLERLLDRPHAAPEPPLGENEMQVCVLRALMREPMGLDGLCEATGRTADELMAELSIMEIMGYIRRDSGNIFAPAIRTSR